MIEYDINQIAPEGEVDSPEENSGSVTEYELILAGILGMVWREAKESVIPAYGVFANDVRRANQVADVSIFDALRQVADSAVRGAVAKLAALFAIEAARNTKRWITNIKKALKIDVSTIVRPEDADELVRLFVQKNTGLIKSLSDDAVKIVEQAVYDAYLQKRSAAELQRDLLSKIKGLRDGRAKLIASDQMSKLNGQLNLLRIRQAGQDQYRWDYRKSIPRKHPRATHQGRHGVIFKIGEPSGDEPSWGIGCKCRARMVVKK